MAVWVTAGRLAVVWPMNSRVLPKATNLTAAAMTLLRAPCARLTGIKIDCATHSINPLSKRNLQPLAGQVTVAMLIDPGQLGE